MNYRLLKMFILLLGIAMLLLSGCQEKNINASISATPQPSATPMLSPFPTSQKSTTYKIGETVKTKKYSVSITNAQKWPGDKNNIPKKGNVFIIIDAVVENYSDGPLFISSSRDFQLVDEEGFSYSYYYGIPNINNFEQELHAGTKVKYQSIIELPASSETVNILYAPAWLERPITFVWNNGYPTITKVKYTLSKKINREVIGQFIVDLNDIKSEFLIKDGYKVELKQYYPDFTLDENGQPITKTSKNPVKPAFIFKIVSPENKNGEVYIAFVRPVDSKQFHEDDINKNSTYAIRTSFDDVEVK